VNFFTWPVMWGTSIHAEKDRSSSVVAKWQVDETIQSHKQIRNCLVMPCVDRTRQLDKVLGSARWKRDRNTGQGKEMEGWN